MDLKLANRIAVVTGGSSGIGLATAKLLLEGGARVAICGRNEARLASAKALLDDIKPGIPLVVEEIEDAKDRAPALTCLTKFTTYHRPFRRGP